MRLYFTKMHALGNDFMVLDGTKQKLSLTAETIRNLANRHTGVGFDQCLVIETSQNPHVNFFYRIYNADGSEVGQCGNGARCLARFIHHYGLSQKAQITIATPTTQMTLQINDNQTITVEMQPPKYQPDIQNLMVNQHRYSFHQIDVGNPHAVIHTDNLSDAPLATDGQQLSLHPFFPHQSNIGFMTIINSSHIQCRIYERGAGETMACGSGAVAAAAIGMLFHGLDSELTVTLPGGDVTVKWPHREGAIFLTGDATFVYEGQLLLDNLT
jgi:diaminopimelate epimerase